MTRMRGDLFGAKKAALHLRMLGVILLPALWLIAKDLLHISDRYLPSMRSVLFDAVYDIKPNVVWHFGVTASRLGVGFILGIGSGVALGLLVFSSAGLFALAMPAIQATRSVPAIAIVPFFLLWFGFAEWGRYLLVVAGTSFNIAVAVLQILYESPMKYKIMFKSFAVRPESRLLVFALPLVSERLLPTLRFSLSSAIGLIVVSELLGSQTGLGYLIQTSRATFSLHVIFLAALLLGILNVAADWLLCYAWSKATYWT